MKTITRNDDNVSILATSDDTPITMQADKVIVGGSAEILTPGL